MNLSPPFRAETSIRWPQVHQLRHRSTFLLAMVVTLCLSCLSGCEKPKPFGGASLTPEQKVEKRATERKVADLILAEDATLDVAPQMKAMSSWFETAAAKSTPPAVLKSLTSSVGLAEIPDLEAMLTKALVNATTNETADGFMHKIDWPIESSKKTTGNPWQPLTSLGVKWQGMKFGILKAEFLDQEKTKYLIHSTVEANAVDAKGRAFGLNGHQTLTFASAGPNSWRLVGWKQEDLTVRVTQQPLFTNVVRQAIVEPKVLARTQQAVKEEMLIKAADTENGTITAPKPELGQWVATDSVSDFPSVSVVDYDNDGFDDLYLTGRWGPTQMLKNQGDGTFKDVTKACGMYFDFQVNTTLFADFDNDGDSDAIVGRAAEPSRYMINDNGVFKDATRTHSNLGKLFFVAGISASDVNRDGLLDVYISTYPPLRNGHKWEFSFIGPKERELYYKYAEGSNPYTDLRGPSNVLLMNRGNGKLERVPFDEALSQWRYSFQSIWADVDNDGDDDVYVCNDFGPDGFLRNDTPRGAKFPTFVEVVDELVPLEAKGFGMGGSWGDFDADGDLDLYVSNMYSKAGNRIMGFLGKVDPILKTSAFGNFLLKNESGKFTQEAGKGAGKYHVNKVGWSYGGQWADFDNNGRLDLYVPSGYYTAPQEISTAVDL